MSKMRAVKPTDLMRYQSVGYLSVCYLSLSNDSTGSYLIKPYAASGSRKPRQTIRFGHFEQFLKRQRMRPTKEKNITHAVPFPMPPVKSFHTSPS